MTLRQRPNDANLFEQQRATVYGSRIVGYLRYYHIRIGSEDSKDLLCNLVLMLADISRRHYISYLGEGFMSGGKL